MVKTFKISGGEVKVSMGKQRLSKSFRMGDHFAYTGTITYNGERMTFPFHDSIVNYLHNKGVTELLILQGVECIILDADAYNANQSVNEFVDEFGYREYKEGEKAYKACRATYERLSKMFTDEEMTELYDIAEKRMNEMLGNK